MISLKSYPEILPWDSCPGKFHFSKNNYCTPNDSSCIQAGANFTAIENIFAEQTAPENQVTSLTDGQRSRHYRLRRSRKVCSMTRIVVSTTAWCMFLAGSGATIHHAVVDTTILVMEQTF